MDYKAMKEAMRPWEANVRAVKRHERNRAVSLLLETAHQEGWPPEKVADLAERMWGNLTEEVQ